MRKHAQKELGAAGAPALAAKTEQLRERWVSDELVEAGRARAASVGWPDAYAYTKALGEQALTEMKGNVPVSIVRPSIIESALAEPFPGWIRGFRMAEPVILSYARGLLKEFPGVPEGTVDVIPVDLVVAAIIAVAAVGPEQAPPITQVASGGINPLRYQLLVDNIRAWFSEHPLFDAEGQPIDVPEWTFPARGRVQKQLKRAKAMAEHGERALQALPLRGKQASWAAKLEEKKNEIDRAYEYVQLYGLYTECEALYQVDNLMRTWAGLSPEDQAAFNFDPRSRRLGEVHHHHPPAVHRAALARQDHAGQEPQRPRRPPAPQRAVARSAPCRVRPREHAHLVERRRELFMVGDTATEHARAHALRVAHAVELPVTKFRAGIATPLLRLANHSGGRLSSSRSHHEGRGAREDHEEHEGYSSCASRFRGPFSLGAEVFRQDQIFESIQTLA